MMERLEPRLLLSAPQAVDDAAVTDLNTLAVIDVLANDEDADPGDVLSLLPGSLSDPAYGSAAIVNNKIEYTPDADFRGSDSLLYTVKDAAGNTDVGKLVIAVAREAAALEDLTSFTLSGNGDVSFTFDGNLDFSIPDEHRPQHFQMEASDGSRYVPSWHYRTQATSRSYDLENLTATATYQWGEATVEWLPHGDKLNARVSITNTTSEAMVGGRYLLGVNTHGPSDLENLTNQWNNPTPSIRVGPTMHALSFTDGSGSYLVGIEAAEPGERAALWGLTDVQQNPRVHFGRIDPSETWTTELTLRVGDPSIDVSTEAPQLAPDIFRDFGRANPFENHWEDRRGIGAVFAASSQYAPFQSGSTTNLRGWAENQLGGPVDVTTPEGIDDFHEAMLDQLETSIANAKGFDWQGLILWDLEGQEGPHPVSTYVGDPESLAFTAPEMLEDYADTGTPFVDYYMQKIEEANLRIGLTLRPTEVAENPSWSGDHASAPWRILQYTTPDPYQVLYDKIDYAVERWGASIFMIDSYTTESIGNGEAYSSGHVQALPASILEQLKDDFPDVLLLPENDFAAHLSNSAPWQATSGQGGGLFHSEQWRRAIWPDEWAFAVNGRQFEQLPDSEMQPGGNGDRVTHSIQRGDIQIANAWYAGQDQNNLDSLYDLHGDPQLDLQDLSTITVDVNGANPVATLEFGRDDRSTPRNATVDWNVQSLPGRLSNPSVSSGELTQPTDTQAITFDVDAQGLGPGLHDLGRIVLYTQGHETWVNVQVNVVTPVGYLSDFSIQVPNASFEDVPSGGGSTDAAHWHERDAVRVTNDSSDGSAAMDFDGISYNYPDARQLAQSNWSFNWNGSQYQGATNTPSGTAYGFSFDGKNQIPGTSPGVRVSPTSHNYGAHVFGYSSDTISSTSWQTYQVAGQRQLYQWGGGANAYLGFRIYQLGYQPGHVMIDNISALQFARPQLAISDSSALDLGTVAASAAVNSSARTIYNSQTTTFTDDQQGAVASTLYGVANITAGDDDTDHVGAIITGGDASLFEFVTSNPGATDQQLQLIGSDSNAGLTGGASPENESLQIRFLGAAEAGAYTTTVRVVTQAANAGTVSAGDPGQPLEGLLYVDIPVTVTVAESMQAGAAQPSTPSPEVISAADAERMLTLAGVYWQKQGFHDAMRLTRDLSISVRDLGGKALGMNLPGQIVLDNDAAGFGWYIDRQPATSQAFFSADTPQGMDLFSVVVHELGHLLGVDHEDGQDDRAMTATLLPGERLAQL